MRTSQEWWNAVLVSNTLTVNWLKKQYHGEVTAAVRVKQFADTYAVEGTQTHKIICAIAAQENQHAAWVKELLVARGIAAELLEKKERYWEQTLKGIDSLETGAGVAAHAETMRLERIRVIVEHQDTPEDIRVVFAKILPQEEFHARAFSKIAGQAALRATSTNHEKGMRTLGLVA